MFRPVFLLTCVISISILSACATPKPVNIEEISARRDMRVAAATWRFEGHTKREITDAIVKTFQYLDQPDVKFDPRENKLLVRRFWTFYAVLAVGAGHEFWEFTFDGNDETRAYTVKSGFGNDNHIGMFISGPNKLFAENLEISGQVGPSANDWNLLHQRVAYFLADQNVWPTCAAFRGKPPEEERSTKFLAFCDQTGIEDRSPEGLPPLP